VVVYRFEDLRVWQAAKKQSNRVGELIKRPEFRCDRELSDQMNAASISVMNNISEGFLRPRDKVDDTESAELVELSNAIGRMIRRLQDTLG
jgi:hypothetical protein